MSESNYTWVCFDCRSSTRQSKTSTDIPKCQSCNDDMFCLGYKVEIPKKNNKKAWSILRNNSRIRLYTETENNNKYKTQLKHFIEKEIIRLESLEKNKDRQKIINEYEKRRVSVFLCK